MIMSVFPFFMTEENKSEPLPNFAPDTKYCNTRFHFCTEFPDTLLPTRLVSDNHDGIILRSSDDEVVVTIAGSRDVMNRDTWDLYDDFVGEWMTDNDDGQIIYEIIQRPSYRVSSIDGDRQYWQKLYHLGNKYVIYQIVAPKNERQRINQIRDNLTISFDM